MSGVIRREDISAKPAFSFARFEEQARQIIVHAEAQARRIVEESESHIHQVTEAHKHEGYQAGLSEGQQAGFEQARRDARAAAVEGARSELEALTKALKSGLAEFERQKHSLLAAAESGLVDLAMAIARRVCKISVEGSTESACANARALLEMVQNQHDLELRLNPTDCDLLPVDVPDFLGNVADLRHVRIVPDPAVGRGGCILGTRDGTIDATIAGQLDRVAEAICTASGSCPAASADGEAGS